MNEAFDLRTRCVLGDPQELHKASPGLLVCEGHREGLYEALRAIVDTLARIAIRPANAGSPGAGRSGSLASQRFVLDLESVALAGPQATGELTDRGGWDGHDTDHPVFVVGQWARLVREDRAITPPDGPAALTSDVDLLVRHLDWCCAQPWIDDMAAELGDSLARVRRADPDRVRPGDEGRCPAVGIGPGDTCGGQLRRERGAVPWLVRPDRCERVPIDVHAGVVRCQKCGRTWPTERDEASLRVMRQSAAREAMRPRAENGMPMVTARELADRTPGKTLRSVQLRLHRLGADPVMDRGMGYYPPDALDQQAAGATG